jgi:hypothetical protein
MTSIATLVLIWPLAFAIVFWPALKFGALIARTKDGVVVAIIKILLCTVIAWNIVLLAWLALVMFGRDVFPPVKNDPLNFGLIFVATLLFVPVAAALIVGYLRARLARERERADIPAPVPFKLPLPWAFAVFVLLWILTVCLISSVHSHGLSIDGRFWFILVFNTAAVLVTAYLLIMRRYPSA